VARGLHRVRLAAGRGREDRLADRARSLLAPARRGRLDADRPVGEPLHSQAGNGNAVKIDARSLVGPLVAALILILTVQQTLGSLHRAGLWAGANRFGATH